METKCTQIACTPGAQEADGSQLTVAFPRVTEVVSPGGNRICSHHNILLLPVVTWDNIESIVSSVIGVIVCS